MRHHIRQILKIGKNVNSILSKTIFEDKTYYLVKWSNKQMPLSWISHQILEAEIEKVRQEIEENIYQDQKEVLNEYYLLDKIVQKVRNHKYSKSQIKILKRKQKRFQNKVKQKLNKLSASKCFEEEETDKITMEIWSKCFYSMKQTDLFEIIGKQKIAGTYYLIKYHHLDNPETFRWENLCSLNTNNRLSRLVQQFDEQYQDSQLPFIKQKYIQYEKNLIQMLQNKNSQRIVSILGKKNSSIYTFYLVKFNNTKLQDSKWVHPSEINSHSKLVTLFNRKEGLKCKSGQFIFIDRNQIKNRINKQNRQTNEQHTNEKFNVFQFTDIHELEKQLDQLEQKFYRQLQDIHRLMNKYQKNYLKKILYGQPDIQQKLSDNYLNFRTIFKKSILPTKQEYSFQYSNQKDESSEEIKYQDDQQYVQSLTTQIGDYIQQKQNYERRRNVV